MEFLVSTEKKILKSFLKIINQRDRVPHIQKETLYFNNLNKKEKVLSFFDISERERERERERGLQQKNVKRKQSTESNRKRER